MIITHNYKFLYPLFVIPSRGALCKSSEVWIVKSEQRGHGRADTTIITWRLYVLVCSELHLTVVNDSEHRARLEYCKLWTDSCSDDTFVFVIANMNQPETALISRAVISWFWVVLPHQILFFPLTQLQLNKVRKWVQLSWFLYAWALCRLFYCRFKD